MAVEHDVCCSTTGLAAPGGCLSVLWSFKDTSWSPVLSVDVSGCKASKSEPRRDHKSLGKHHSSGETFIIETEKGK